jgi:hypothetical protein
MGLWALQTLTTTTHVEPTHMLVGAHLRNVCGNVMIVGHNQAYEWEGPSYWPTV